MSSKWSSVVDIEFMQQAINLAKLGRYTTTPNPNVGCVLVNDNQVVGQGYHQKAGLGHAEVNALAQAGELAQGATAYVTLEPCSHFGRTPPCAQGLIDAGVARVVIAMVDPNPQVAGRGIKMLEAAGVSVTSNVLEAQARALNPGFLSRMERKRPFVQVKLGSTLDGCTALSHGQSQWITSADSRVDVQAFRAQSCAILTGSNTVLADNPSLNLRWDELGKVKSSITEQQLRQPIRIVLDSKNRVKPSHKMISIESSILLVRRTQDALSWPSHVEQLVIPGQGAIDLTQLMSVLAKRDINLVWVEAGQTLSGGLLEANLVDEIIIYQAPKLMGSNNKGLFSMPSVQGIEQLVDLTIKDLRMVGQDIRVIASPQRKQS
ncbi:bifunctional diaminohydroxyphosphoribosylaminopyrimidine deaminase/5-amino-6-(5-phosphoribosylamino)uracil reductase RibD [Psychrobium sp. 1_MG-2023]|uniref:bifunctional diaminohydroxyphosphoribosylaminopyrimidine deaminase/5-amino-6-(5-phosphoribosylamino)uracil reductase RibD n=1 Tax=Psychrobium sp. 1_MG-2023 TaxID=3062624 RepID=UPI000C3479A1|nr:bifunctional diaminohydroxyphosphoribosylaminopyrimidine deaminase/5-amino-6-(5-phosphoribosylamino)uracil reductase RibD [Psychrobium sp. 1_MG-2023]MDP2561817.1 bifunctional diaminohydroxyphosphoribosylaminopyrimidine deaminase/5-amino-6-(5-phosphoribosylamino)uracil reductase RibD [Psychrobium sp. 1_MG-2023]PKF55810.1 bifunctional diaminohydroxyphosphoribosylaminopyrimidine deaminase/5-amino-6-(5-phosphoribosylamino)uracil reductase RibD [Alteromonadales bacterium alter-6D02]